MVKREKSLLTKVANLLLNKSHTNLRSVHQNPGKIDWTAYLRKEQYEPNKSRNPQRPNSYGKSIERTRKDEGEKLEPSNV